MEREERVRRGEVSGVCPSNFEDGSSAGLRVRVEPPSLACSSLTARVRIERGPYSIAP